MTDFLEPGQEHAARTRLRGGLLNKARRGELRCHLPVGFVHDPQGRVVLDPDQQVQASVRLLFKTFARTGAAHATIKHFRKEPLQDDRKTHGMTGRPTLMTGRPTR